MFKNLRMQKVALAITILIAVCASQSIGAIIADHTASAEFDLIPTSYFSEIESNYNIYYVHTSHGSQIMTGITMLEAEDALYDAPYFYEVGDDLGHNGDTSWAQPARDYLDSHSECNMVMFSWCGGCSDNNEEGINIYLNKMNDLEIEYPAIKFIYMTGHLDGGGVSGTLYTNNNQIRAYCAANNKILFDFADIESYDPDGTYYPDESDGCAWCSDWCSVHTCPTCASCAHSHCYNCYLKGKAWWWMMAKISGWTTGSPVCGDVNSDGLVNVIDISYIIAYLYTGGPAPSPLELADVNSSGMVNILDVTYLISFLYASGPDPTCPE